MSDPYKKREMMKYRNPIPSREFILKTIVAEKKQLNFKNLAQILKIKQDQFDAVKARLSAMVRDGQLQIKKGYYTATGFKKKLLQGVVNRSKDGSVYILSHEEKQLKVSSFDGQYLLNGDIVHYRLVKDLKETKALIVDILERSNSFLLGFIDKNKKYFFPLQKGLSKMIIDKNLCLVSETADFVFKAENIVMKAREWYVDVVAVQGSVMDKDMAETVAWHCANIKKKINKKMQAELKKLEAEVDNIQDESRENWSHLPLVTIDGASAKDFDDAVYAEKFQNGWKLYVAIADVAHYVPLGSAIDEYAFTQTTSVYYPKKTYPMLPEILSNELCSLKPNVNRLALGVVLYIDDSGNIIKGDIKSVMIKSHARFTYDEVEDMIIKNTDAPEFFKDSLKAMMDLSNALYQASVKRKAFEFPSRTEFPVFNQDGIWDKCIIKETFWSQKLIEMFMITTNNFVAEFLLSSESGGIFRHHPEMKEDAHFSLLREIKNLDIDLGSESFDLYQVNEKLKKHESYKYLSPLVIRSMSQARYETDLSGHWGLSLDAYTHFTSPIRRYPDLMAHRAIKSLIKGKVEKKLAPLENANAALKCSRLERSLDASVYDALDWYQCQWAYLNIGKDYRAHVVSSLQFCLFVKVVEVGVELALSASHLTSLGYVYSANTQLWFYQDKNIVIGSEILIKIDSVNFMLRRRDALLLF